MIADGALFGSAGSMCDGSVRSNSTNDIVTSEAARDARTIFFRGRDYPVVVINVACCHLIAFERGRTTPRSISDRARITYGLGGFLILDLRQLHRDCGVVCSQLFGRCTGAYRLRRYGKISVPRLSPRKMGGFSRECFLLCSGNFSFAFPNRADHWGIDRSDPGRYVGFHGRLRLWGMGESSSKVRAGSRTRATFFPYGGFGTAWIRGSGVHRSVFHHIFSSIGGSRSGRHHDPTRNLAWN